MTAINGTEGSVLSVDCINAIDQRHKTEDQVFFAFCRDADTVLFNLDRIGVVTERKWGRRTDAEDQILEHEVELEELYEQLSDLQENLNNQQVGAPFAGRIEQVERNYLEGVAEHIDG